MRTLILLFVLIGIYGMASTVSGQSRLSIVGCYSDVKPVPEGEILGNGSFRILKSNGKYSATFAELISDSGEQANSIVVKNLRVDTHTNRISFDLPLNRGGKPVVIRNVSGRISGGGIKMNWHGDRGEYGQPNPFLHRRSKNCI